MTLSGYRRKAYGNGSFAVIFSHLEAIFRWTTAAEGMKQADSWCVPLQSLTSHIVSEHNAYGSCLFIDNFHTSLYFLFYLDFFYFVLHQKIQNMFYQSAFRHFQNKTKQNNWLLLRVHIHCSNLTPVFAFSNWFANIYCTQNLLLLMISEKIGFF